MTLPSEPDVPPALAAAAALVYAQDAMHKPRPQNLETDYGDIFDPFGDKVGTWILERYQKEVGT